MIDSKKIVILLSGGLDSAVLLKQVISGGYKPIALSFDYGQLHAQQELDRARALAEREGVHWITRNIKTVFHGIVNPLLGDGTMPEGSYKEQLKGGELTTYIPNRNMIMISIAAAHAIERQAAIVGYAAHDGEIGKEVYSDCTVPFVTKMDSVLYTQGISLYAPFIKWDKAAIVQRGLDLGVDFSSTWSCYSPMNEKPCMKCGTCIDRAQAFDKLAVKDPLL